MVVLQVSTDFDPVFFFPFLSVYVCGTHTHITCVYELKRRWGGGLNVFLSLLLIEAGPLLVPELAHSLRLACPGDPVSAL